MRTETARRAPARLRLPVLVLTLALLSGCGGKAASPDSGGQNSPELPRQGTAPAPAAGVPSTGPAEGIAEGLRAPEIVAKDVFTQETVTLSSLRGQVVFLNFWATWCPPCKAEMPEMERFWQQHQGEVRVLAIGADSAESPDELFAYAKNMGLTFSVAHDGGKASEKYQLLGIPTSFFIDANGIIRTKYQGALTFAKMEKYSAEAGRLGKQ